LTCRGEITAAALLLKQFRLMVDHTTGIDVHAKRSRAKDVFIDPGIPADPHADPPAIHLDGLQPATGTEILVFVPPRNVLQ
jgi:hypothetical protein